MASAGAACLLATTGVIAAPVPAAAAAHAVPWRFATLVSADESIAAYDGTEHTGDYLLQCPAGYIPVSGGVKAGAGSTLLARLLESTDTNAGGFYHIILINLGFPAVSFTISATCVWADDIGTITYVSAAFTRSAGGWAGGELLCPNGTTTFSASVDWSLHAADRTLNYSRPVTRGTQNGEGWYVAGYSPSNGATLGLSLRCVDLSLLTGETVVTSDGDSTAVASCASGARLLNGGVGPTEDEENAAVDQGWGVSGAYDYYRYAAFGSANGVTFRDVALCVPSSTASAEFTQTPPALSTATSGSITFTASDSAGESVTPTCYLDGVLQGCASGFPNNFGPLAEGPHSYDVYVKNQYGTSGPVVFGWTIDSVPPTIVKHSPSSGLGLNAPVTITFSEPVQGVGISSVLVHAQSANVAVSGKTARPTSTTATWTPTAPLVPGETYRFSITSTVHDLAGNHLAATFFNVRAATTVENTSTAMHEYWDLDSSAIASGGSYISSRVAGSRADLTFTTTAGQTVGVWGIRAPNGGNARIYVDGVLASNPSFYAATTARNEVYLSGPLTAGSHTISIRPLGTKPSASSGAWVGIDSLDVGATVNQESALTQRFPRVTNAGAYGSSYDVMLHKTDTDAAPRFQATVVGTGVKVYATETATSGSAKIYVDGVLKATVNLHAATTTYRVLVYSGSFSLGVHVVKVVAVGTSSGSGSDVGLDRLTVT
ncbi:MAG TPA: Ig-like domain-containing protein [Candidatus Limnocylindrales bacterium]